MDRSKEAGQIHLACYVTGQKDKHWGIDIRANEGTAIRSPADGKVSYISTDPNSEGGISIKIDHQFQYDGQNVTTGYAHLSRIGKDIADGTNVSAGQIIGYTGNTGTHTSGAHLHFTTRLGGPDGKFTDPKNLFPEW